LSGDGGRARADPFPAIMAGSPGCIHHAERLPGDLDRTPSHGKEGFARTVALHVPSSDFHSLGLPGPVT